MKHNEHLIQRNQEIQVKARILWENYFIWKKNGKVLRKNEDGAESIITKFDLSTGGKKLVMKKPTKSNKRTIEALKPTKSKYIQ